MPVADSTPKQAGAHAFTSPVEEMRESREGLIDRFARGALSDSVEETYTEMVDQYFRRTLVESESGQRLLRERGPLAFVL